MGRHPIEKNITRKALELELQAKQEIDKVKAKALKKTTLIKSELQYTIDLVNNMYQVQIRPIEYLRSEFKIQKRGMIDTPRLERWSEDIDSAITLVLEILDEQMKHLEINASTVGEGIVAGITDI